jgi:hypothetical protein
MTENGNSVDKQTNFLAALKTVTNSMQSAFANVTRTQTDTARKVPKGVIQNDDMIHLVFQVLI